MAETCICPPCKGKVITKISRKITRNQVLMLGYFCYECITVQCADTHRGRKRLLKNDEAA